MRVCLVGAGAVSGNHVAGILAAGQELVAVCDILPERGEALCRRFGLTLPIYSDYREMLAKEKPDAVHICTPHYLHTEMALAALAGGAHVFSEKPVSITPEDFERLLCAEETSGRQYGVCFQNRVLPCNTAARDFLKTAKPYSASGSVLWRRDAAYYASGDWRGKWETEGGGALINQAIHTLDLLVTLMGKPVSVKAEMKNIAHQGVCEVEDFAYLAVETTGGNFTLTATTAADDSYPVKMDFETCYGTLTVQDGDLYRNGARILSDDGPEALGKKVWGYGHGLLIDLFYRSITEGTPFPCDLASTEDTMRTVFAAYRSAKSGKREPVYPTN